MVSKIGAKHEDCGCGGKTKQAKSETMAEIRRKKLEQSQSTSVDAGTYNSELSRLRQERMGQ